MCDCSFRILHITSLYSEVARDRIETEHKTSELARMGPEEVRNMSIVHTEPAVPVVMHNRSEVACRRSEVSHRVAEVVHRMTEVVHRMTEVRHKKNEVACRRSEVPHKKTEVVLLEWDSRG